MPGSRFFIAGLLLAAMPLVAVTQTAQESPAGRYELRRINRTRLPVFKARESGVGGTSIRSGVLELRTDDRFEARVVLYQVGRGQRTVDTLVATGTWATKGDSVRIDYTWRRGDSAPASDRVVAAVNDSTVSLPRLGFLNPWWFGARAGQIRWLRFQRAAAR